MRQNFQRSLGLGMILSTMMILCHPSVQAQELDAASQEALGQTQELLRNQSQRQNALKGNNEASAADQNVQNLVGSGANTERTYEISAKVLAELVKSTNGDSAKMQELLQKAQKDPAAFLKSLSPEQQKAIKGLAQDVERKPTNAPGQR